MEEKIEKNQTEKTQNKNNKTLLIVIGLIVLVIIAVVVLLLVNNNDKKPEEKEKEPSTEEKEPEEQEQNQEPISILGGTLPACSGEHLTDGDYTDENTNIVFSDENYTTTNGDRTNNSSKIKEKKELEGLVITDTTITSKRCREKFATVSATVTNNGSEDLFERVLAFNFVDKDGKKTNTVEYILTLKKGETKKIDTGEILSRIIDAYDYTPSYVYY